MIETTALRRHIPLFRNLVRREIRQRHKGSVLGLAWNLVIPGVLVATYSFIFRYLFPNRGFDDYAVYLITGMAAWAFFSTGAQVAASSLVANANLIKKVRFPRQIIPLAAIAGNAFTAVAMLAIAILLCLIIRDGNPITFVTAPVFVLLLLVFTAGFGLVLSALNVYLRDVEYLYGALLTPWFFMTPILFSFNQDGIRGHETVIRVLHYANPITPFVLGIQDSLFYKRWPAVGDLAYCAIAAGLMLIVGMWTFRKLERDFAVEL
jgi:lipopolysaccharide transport system permease protein